MYVAQSIFEMLEHSSCRLVVNRWQYIKKCSSSSAQFCLHTKHVRCSTGIDTPLFHIFQSVFVSHTIPFQHAWHPTLSFVRLIYVLDL